MIDGTETPIADEEILWRRIPFVWIVESDGSLSSAAFLERDDDLAVSVHRALLITAEAVWRRSTPQHGVVALRASIPREFGYRVEPRPEATDISHAVLIPPEGFGQKKQRNASREFGRRCEWTIRPDRNRTEFIEIHQ